MHKLQNNEGNRQVFQGGLWRLQSPKFTWKAQKSHGLGFWKWLLKIAFEMAFEMEKMCRDEPKWKKWAHRDMNAYLSNKSNHLVPVFGMHKGRGTINIRPDCVPYSVSSVLVWQWAGTLNILLEIYQCSVVWCAMANTINILARNMPGTIIEATNRSFWAYIALEAIGPMMMIWPWRQPSKWIGSWS